MTVSHDLCHVVAYLFQALSISMITSVESAMDGGWLSAKIEQSTPLKRSSCTRHCDWWVYDTTGRCNRQVCAAGATDRCVPPSARASILVAELGWFVPAAGAFMLLHRGECTGGEGSKRNHGICNNCNVNQMAERFPSKNN